MRKGESQVKKCDDCVATTYREPCYFWRWWGKPKVVLNCKNFKPKGPFMNNQIGTYLGSDV